MFEKDNRIQSPELAEEMAYAEKPFRALAFHALQAGNFTEQKKYLSSANTAAILSAREYIGRLSMNLDFYEKSANIEAEFGPYVQATERDMLDFAHDEEDPKAAQPIMSRIWTAYAYSAKHLESDYPGQFIFRVGANPQNPQRVLQEIKLTQHLVDDSAYAVRNMGPKSKAVLQKYYDKRRAETVESALDI